MFWKIPNSFFKKNNSGALANHWYKKLNKTFLKIFLTDKNPTKVHLTHRNYLTFYLEV